MSREPTRNGIVLAALALAVAAGVPRPAAAQDEGADEAAQAKQFFTDAVAAFNAGEHEKALEAFKMSYELKPLYSLRFNMGLCYTQLGLLAKAKAEFVKYLQEGGDKVTAAKKKELEKAIKELEAVLGKVTVMASVDGTAVTLDGDEIGQTPGLEDIEVDPGPHILGAAAEGFETFEIEFVIQKGEKKTIDVTLEPLTLKKKVEKKTEKPVVEPPPVKKEKLPGIEYEGLAPPPEETPPVEKKPAGAIIPKKTSLPLLLTTAVLAVGMAAAGTATIGLAYDKKKEMKGIDDDYRDDPGSFASYADYIAARDTIAGDGKDYLTMSAAFYSVATVFTVTAAVVGALGRPKKEKKQDAGAREPVGVFEGVTLAASGDGASVSLSVRF